jgi:hypothetical protein
VPRVPARVDAGRVEAATGDFVGWRVGRRRVMFMILF